MHNIQLVVFDLGRVLLRIADDWEHAFANAGITPRPGLTGDISAGTRRQHDPQSERMFHGFEIGKIDNDTFFNFAAKNVGLTVRESKKLLDAWLIQRFPGVEQLLDELEKQPVKTACFSNTNAHHWQSITDPAHPAYCPVDHLDFPFASHLIGHAKPHPDAYAHVEQATNIAPQNILFFDDLSENIATAQQRNWQGVVVERCDNPLPFLRQELQRYGVL